jgi:hypothetical protein
LPTFALGTDAELTIESGDGSPKQVHVVLPKAEPGQANAKLPMAQPSSVTAREITPGIGYVKIAFFPGVNGQRFAGELDRALAEIPGCTRMIVDLRGNLGGFVGSLRLMSYLTPDRVPVGYSLTRKGEDGKWRPDIDALDPDLISSVLLADPDGQRLWPKAGRRVPEDWKQFITPLPIGPCVGACGTAAFRKERVINQDIATDPLWSGAAEKYRAVALQHGFRSTWSVPLLSKDGNVLGTFGLYHTKANAVRADEIELVEEAGNIALLAIERHGAQAALTNALATVRKSESELRTMVDMIPQMIAVLAPDGKRREI